MGKRMQFALSVHMIVGMAIRCSSAQLALFSALFMTPSAYRIANTAAANASQSLTSDPQNESSRSMAALPVACPDRTIFDWQAWAQEFEEESFEQQLDHTNAYHQQASFLNHSTTFRQRYWVNKKAWDGAAAKAPIFVIVNAFSPSYYQHAHDNWVGDFRAAGHGLVGEMARSMGAMVVRVESRFLPGSLPFDESDLKQQPNRLGLLSPENAMRDFVMLLSHLRDLYDPEWVCPTGTFGVGWDGMYSAWLRYKFPNVVDFAFASGAPMIGYPNTDGTGVRKVQTQAWFEASGNDTSCMELIRDSLVATQADDCGFDLTRTILYESAYLAYPPRGRIQKFCGAAAAKKAEGGSPLEVAKELIKQHYNGESCFQRGEGPSNPVGSYTWCTHIFQEWNSDGVDDFFPPFNAGSFDVWYAPTCRDGYGIEPLTPNYHADIFGWHRPLQLADSVSRILFTYGTYDGRVAQAISTSDVSVDLPVIMVKGGGEGSDFYGTVREDTADMLAAREKMSQHVARWVKAVQARQ